MLVASVALERGIAVDAVLPMPLEEYSKDFSPASLTELHRLLEHANVTRAVLEPPPGWSSSTLPPTGERRDALYVNLSDMLVRKSNLLIALWDGQFIALPGGTTDTVLKYLAVHSDSGRATQTSVIEDDGSPLWERQIVYWVNVPRAEDRPDGRCAAPCFLSGVGEGVLRRHPQMPKQLRQQLIDLDHYNHEFATLQSQPYALLPDTLMREVPATISPEERAQLRRIDVEYGKADTLAVFCQFHSHRLFRWFSYMASTMGLLFLIYAKLVPNKIFLLGYLTVLVLGLGVFHVLKSRHWFTKHLVYRVLAETMRTKFFLRLTAADRQVSAAELIKLSGIDQFNGFGWLTNVLKNVEPLTNGHAVTATQEDDNLGLVRRIWIESQQRYFRSKVGLLERTHKRLERLKTGLVYTLALITTVLVVLSEPLSTYFLDIGFNGKDLLLFLMGLLPVWLGIWEIYQGKMATRELLWQYRNQLDHFSRASIELAQANDRQRRVSILADLGRDSLMESYLWTIHRY
ncbi:MAG TPA: hypothetical protein VFB99_02110, partial [Vicinamibacterales bacterium]|nr:hypothetical protein [Vicinamibacterales bacterium]